MVPLLVYSFWSVLIQSSLEISLGGNKVHAHRLKLPDQKRAMDRSQNTDLYESPYKFKSCPKDSWSSSPLWFIRKNLPPPLQTQTTMNGCPNRWPHIQTYLSFKNSNTLKENQKDHQLQCQLASAWMFRSDSFFRKRKQTLPDTRWCLLFHTACVLESRLVEY